VRPFVVALVLVMTGCELAGFAAAQTGSSLAFNPARRIADLLSRHRSSLV
jgi:hypothetical protein